MNANIEPTAASSKYVAEMEAEFESEVKDLQENFPLQMWTVAIIVACCVVFFIATVLTFLYRRCWTNLCTCDCECDDDDDDSNNEGDPCSKYERMENGFKDLGICPVPGDLTGKESSLPPYKEQASDNGDGYDQDEVKKQVNIENLNKTLDGEVYSIQI